MEESQPNGRLVLQTATQPHSFAMGANQLATRQQNQNRSKKGNNHKGPTKETERSLEFLRVSWCP